MIEQLNRFADRCSVELWLLSNPVSDGATGVSTGPDGGADPHGHCGAFGCYFQPASSWERSGGMKFACCVWWSADPNR